MLCFLSARLIAKHVCHKNRVTTSSQHFCPPMQIPEACPYAHKHGVSIAWAQIPWSNGRVHDDLIEDTFHVVLQHVQHWGGHYSCAVRLLWSYHPTMQSANADLSKTRTREKLFLPILANPCWARPRLRKSEAQPQKNHGPASCDVSSLLWCEIKSKSKMSCRNAWACTINQSAG